MNKLTTLLLNAVAAILLTLGLAAAPQPHMQNALTALRNARRALIDAAPDRPATAPMPLD